jgi:phage/plasmid-like protein (TIGR03299 family)
MQFSDVRIVCANTLRMALQGSEDGINIRHTANAMTKVAEAQRALGLAQVHYDLFEKKANAMLATKFTDKMMLNVVESLFPANEDNVVTTRTQNSRDALMSLWTDGAGIKPIRGTQWAAFNAAAELADHFRPTRAVNGQDARESKLQSIWFGSSQDFKADALNAIEAQVAMVEAGNNVQISMN